MQKIAVFGGTFNPIHNGHIHLSEQFADRLKADHVLLIPTNIPPHKQIPDLASAEDRLAMCRLAAESTPLFQVSDLEIRRGGRSYTFETLQFLKKTYPDSELYLITGEDMFLTMDQWVRPDVIFSLATICAAPRSKAGCKKLMDYSAYLQQSGARTRIENISYLPVSSTMVRNAVKDGKKIDQDVPLAVARYIYQNHLYLE